jgi:hypothetical protein
MVQLSEDLPFDLQARFHRACERAAVHQLDRNLLLEFSVGSLGEINLAHAAHAQDAEQAVRSDAVCPHAGSMRHASKGAQTAPALRRGAASVYEIALDRHAQGAFHAKRQ